MNRSTAAVATDRPERYIKQPASHMSHKTTTELDDDRGTITRHLLRIATQEQLVVVWSSPIEQPAPTVGDNERTQK